MHTVLYFAPHTSAWYGAFTAADEDTAVQVSSWLNEIGWSSRIEQDQATSSPVVGFATLDTTIGPMASC